LGSSGWVQGYWHNGPDLVEREGGWMDAHNGHDTGEGAHHEHWRDAILSNSINKFYGGHAGLFDAFGGEGLGP